MHSISSLARTLARKHAGIIGVLVVDADGHAHASETTAPDIVRSAVAAAVSLRNQLDRASAELGKDQMCATVLMGRVAHLAIADVDGVRMVIVVGASGAAPEALRAASLWMADCMRSEADRA